jgi:hypothetical protein
MALILIVRHGQPDWLFADRLGLRGAQRNLMCLTAREVSQVEGMAVNPLLEGAELILSGPYTRALHSAAIISQFRRLHVQVEHNLYEWIPDRTFPARIFLRFERSRMTFAGTVANTQRARSASGRQSRACGHAFRVC